jgi:DNA-binding transcriptional regulator GbsR (MarR family)
MSKRIILSFTYILFQILPTSSFAEGYNLGEDSERSKLKPLIQKSSPEEEDPTVKALGRRTESRINDVYDLHIKNSDAKTKEIQSWIARDRDSLSKAKEILNEAEKNEKSTWFANAGASVGKIFGVAPDQETVAKYNSARNVLDKAEEYHKSREGLLKDSEAALQKSEELNFKLLEKQTMSKERISKEIRLLQEHLKRSDAMRDFKDMKSDFLEVDDQLSVIEDQLDRSAIGNYVQTKMGLFMNSNSMCSAVKECRSKSRPNVSQSKLRNEVFNDKTLNPGEKKDTSSSTEDVLQ